MHILHYFAFPFCFPYSCTIEEKLFTRCLTRGVQLVLFNSQLNIAVCTTEECGVLVR